MGELPRYLASPFQDPRPSELNVDLVVVHAISLPPGQFGGPWVDDLFLGRLDPSQDPYFAEIASLRVSSHFMVNRQGQITQYVPILRRAWHAGLSQWQGRNACNDFAVGVELEGDQIHPFEPRQYRRLAELTRTLALRLPGLVGHRLAGHQHVAPGRKWDPGPGFDWEFLGRELTAAMPHPEWPLIWD